MPYGCTLFLLVVRCPRLLPPPHSVQSGCGAGAMYNVFGDKCLLYCDVGYRLINGSTERICQANGTWSGQAPYCQGKHGRLLVQAMVQYLET